MTHPNTKFLRAVGMMIGAIIGVGVFGLPYAFAQSGVGLGLLELLIMGILLVFLQLMFAEVAIQTPGHSRLVGYVEIYIGRFWKWVTLAAMAFGIWGAMIAYMIVGGRFLHILLNPVFGGEEVTYSYVVAVIASILFYGGLKFASRLEVVIIGALLFLFLFIVLASIPELDMRNFTGFDLSNAFVPYGVVLFSLAGVGIVPEMKDLLGRRSKRELAPAVMLAMGIILLLYIFFALAVVGVTGLETTQTAFDGLVFELGTTFTIVATLLGSLTIISIYMVLGIELLNTFRFDFRLSHKISWLLVAIVPVVLFRFGVREFIELVGFVGAVFGGTLGILIALMYWKMRRSPVCKKQHCINFPAPLTWLIILLFGGGIVLQLFDVLLK